MGAGRGTSAGCGGRRAGAGAALRPLQTHSPLQLWGALGVGFKDRSHHPLGVLPWTPVLR